MCSVIFWDESAEMSKEKRNEEIRIPEEQEEKNMGLHDGFVGRLKEEIKAESANGYKGLVKVYDRGFEKRFELFIFDFHGHEVLHSYAGNVKTKEELQETLDTFPEFLRALRAGGEK